MSAHQEKKQEQTEKVENADVTEKEKKRMMRKTKKLKVKIGKSRKIDGDKRIALDARSCSTSQALDLGTEG